MIRKRGRKGFCSAEFMIDGHTYQFTFNGKKGMPLITSKKEAREYEDDLRRQVVSGLLLKYSDLKNFAKFFNQVYMDYSRKHKVTLSTEFDEYYGKLLVGEFGKRTLSQISPRMIEDYLVTLLETKTRYDKPYSPVTVRRHYNMLNQVFNMAIRERWLNKYASDEEDRLFAAFNEYGAHLPAICRIVLNTGIRPPKEVLAIKKEHVNLSDDARYCKIDKTDVLIPPRAVLVAKGKDGRPRVLPLNSVAQKVFNILVADCATGNWLFPNRNGERIQAIRKGFTAACRRAGIADLRAYDLRHTFATRLLEHGVHHYVISALLGHSSPAAGAGFGSRMTPGYAHVSWETMVKAVDALTVGVYKVPAFWGSDSGKIPANPFLAQKAV